MVIEILTIFPQVFSGFLSESLIGKAVERGLLSAQCTNIRDFAELPHQKVDDSPYGGGAGMVMKPEPLTAAVEAAKKRLPNARVICFSPAGTTFNQTHAERLAQCPELILLCGRYEGIDQRVIDTVVDEEISIGDYILMGGEVAAMALIEACIRLKESVIGNSESTVNESFSEALGRETIEAPHYTRPPVFRGLSVPEELLSGNHQLIEKWRKTRSSRRSSRS